MTKKDYVAIAEIISKNRETIDDRDTFGGLIERFKVVRCDELVGALCQFFESDNPNFDESSFRAACKGK